MAPHPVRPIRLPVAAVAMVLATLAVAAAGTHLVLASATVGALDDAGVAWGTGLADEHAWLREAARAWALLSLPGVVHLVVLTLAVSLVVRRRAPVRTLLLVPAGLGGWALEVWCKELVARPRPIPADPVTTVTGWSFPSGHATNAAIGAVSVIVLARALRAAWVRWGAAVLALIGTAVTALDRVVLGVHFVSDVTAGLLLGLVLGLLGAWGAGLIGPRSGSPLRSPNDG